MSEGRTPTPEQAAAIESRGTDLLLEAGAGTGKTGALVDRYCGLIAEDGLAPDRILAFTFTDKAAAQLRERIRAELSRRAAAAEEPARGELERVVAEFGGAWVTTIHGFCRRLLASHPVAAGIDPGFRVLEASEAERASRAAFDAALEEFLAEEEEERATTVAAYRVDGLRTLVVGAHEQLRSRGHEAPELPEPPSVAPGESLAELKRCAAAALQAGGLGPRQRRVIERAFELAGGGGDGATPSLDEIAALGFNASSGPAAECLAALRTATSRLAEREGGERAYRHVAELVRLFGRHFEAAKGARGGLDFEDLQLRAVRLLRDSQPIGDAYRGRFEHLLVDEFQDTNALQLGLIEVLRGTESRLFLVGDEFQSIYGFRHADLEVFRQQRRRFSAESGADVLRLSGNFRSRPEIVAAANRLGSDLIGPGFRPLTVGAEPEPDDGPAGPRVELLLTSWQGWDGLDLQLPVDDRTPQRHVAEARFLAARLRELAEAGVPRGEMVVLLRAFTRVDAYEEALERAGLRPYVVGGRGYWSQQQVEDLRSLLATIANPLDDEPLLGALASPACGVSPDALWLLRAARGEGRSLWPALRRAIGAGEAELDDEALLEQMPAEDLERLAAFHVQVLALREAGTRLGLEELIERAVTDTGYDLAALMRPSGHLRIANVRKLMRLAREYEERDGRHLRGFLDYLDFRSAVDDEAAAATEVEDHDGVRVMTVHNAKGLEFGVVAVPDLDRNLLKGGRDPWLRIGRDDPAPPRVGMRLARLGGRSLPLYDFDALGATQQQRDEEEALRLFYVAATRARRRLILSGVVPSSIPAETKPGTPIICRLLRALGIEDAPDGHEVEIGPAEPRPGLDASFAPATILVRRNEASAEQAEGLVRRAEAPPPAQPLGAGPPPLARPPAPAAPLRPLSYSALAAYQRCGYRFYAERVLGLPARVPRRGAASDGAAGTNGAAATREERFGFGSAVHELLEWSAERRWLLPGEQLTRRRLQGAGVLASPEQVGRAREQVHGWIDSPLRRELARSGARLRAELPLLLSLGGAVLRGSIDLLAEQPDQAPLVLDYKTDRLEGAPPAERAMRYEIQRGLYAVAAAAATGAESVRVAYVFLERPREPAIELLDAGRIAAARAELEELVARIGAGEFAVTATPDWPLCHDCPARRRLCSGPAEPPAGP